MKIRDDLLRREAQLNTVIQICSGIIRKAPGGALRCRQIENGSWHYYKLRRNKDGRTISKYIRSSDEALAARLAEKDYAEKTLRLAKEERNAIHRFLNQYKPEALTDAYRSLSPGRKRLLGPLSEIDVWADDTWDTPAPQGFSSHQEGLLFQTRRGEFVRSKSELLIADFLYEHGLYYIYEQAYYFNYSTGSSTPDFTVISRSGEIYYWEHFGRMDDPEYVQNSFMYKMDRYARDGLFPGKGLIITLENQQQPLTSGKIKQVAEYYLL